MPLTTCSTPLKSSWRARCNRSFVSYVAYNSKYLYAAKKRYLFKRYGIIRTFCGSYTQHYTVAFQEASGFGETEDCFFVTTWICKVSFWLFRRLENWRQTHPVDYPATTLRITLLITLRIPLRYLLYLAHYPATTLRIPLLIFVGIKYLRWEQERKNASNLAHQG